MLTKEEIDQMISTFTDHINEGKITPNHQPDCGYCRACQTAIDLAAENERLKGIVEFMQEWVDHHRPWLDEDCDLTEVDKVLWPQPPKEEQHEQSMQNLRITLYLSGNG